MDLLSTQQGTWSCHMYRTPASCVETTSAHPVVSTVLPVPLVLISRQRHWHIYASLAAQGRGLLKRHTQRRTQHASTPPCNWISRSAISVVAPVTPDSNATAAPGMPRARCLPWLQFALPGATGGGHICHAPRPPRRVRCGKRYAATAIRHVVPSIVGLGRCSRLP